MRSDTGKLYDEVLLQLAMDPKVKKTNRKQIITTISEVLAKTLDIEQVTIYTLEPGCLDLTPIDRYDAAERKHVKTEIVQMNQIPKLYHALVVNRYLDIYNLKEDPLYESLIENDWFSDAIKSSLLVPIRGKGQLTGLVVIDQARSRRIWVEDEILFACQVADMISMVLIYGELLNSHQATEMVLAFARDLQTHDNFDLLSERFVQYLARAMQVDSVLVFKVDSNLQRLWATSTHKAPIGYEKMILGYREGIAGMVASHSRTITIHDYAQYENREKFFDENQPFKMVMAKPIIRKGQVAAVIQVMRKDNQQSFDQFDECIMEQMIAWYGVLIDQMQINEKAQLLRDYQKTLNRIVEASYFSSSTQDLLNTTMDYVIPVFKARMGILVLDQWKVVRGVSDDFEHNLSELLAENKEWRTAIVSLKNVDEANDIHPMLIDLVKTTDMQSLVLSPIMMDEKRIGYMLLGSNTFNQHNIDDVTLVEITCKHLALEFRRLNTYKENQNRSNLVWRMNNLGNKLSHTLSYGEAIEVVGNAAVDMMVPDHAFFLLRQPGGEAKNMYSYAIPGWVVQQFFDEEGEAMENLFMHTAYPHLIVPEETNGAGIPAHYQRYIDSESIQGIKIMPLIHQEQQIGAFVAMYKDERTWPDYEREMVIVFARTAVLTLQNAWMYDELEKGYLDLAVALAGAMDNRETTLSDSTMKIATYAERTARYLGCSEDEVQDIRWAALLHDIGKLEIPDHVLRKPGPLSQEEWELVQQAPEEAEKLLKPLTRYQPVSLILSNFREHFDGSGYPNQTKGRQIPLGGRILAVAEAFVSMIDHRSYRKAMDFDEAVGEIIQNSGSQFDPIIVDAFMHTVRGADVTVG